jgi:hypothetical protein
VLAAGLISFSHNCPFYHQVEEIFFICKGDLLQN